MISTKDLPPWGQLILPLLDTLQQTGETPAKSACRNVGESLGLHPEIRDAIGKDSLGRTFNLLDRRIRWVKQSCSDRGLVTSPSHGIWTLTPQGEELAASRDPSDPSRLGKIQRGKVVTLFTNARGTYFWGHAEDVVSRLEDQSIHLLFTSPPYPLSRKKEYGNLRGEAYLDWLEAILDCHLPKLAPDAGILLNLGEAYECPGESQLSTYREELTLRARKNLGLKLFGKFYWQNPSKPPAGHWVTHAKCRPKNDTEEILWLAAGTTPKFRGANALNPYGPTMTRTLAQGGETRGMRPSGHGDSKCGFSIDHGGSWPGQSLSIPNSSSQGPYFSFCKSHGLPSHPARFPGKLAEKMILLHSDPNDTISDPFGGSANTAAAAQKLGRNWTTCDIHLAYGLGAIGRFPTLVN